MNKRMTIVLLSLVFALLLAGLCSCKQDAAPGSPASGVKNLDQSLIEAQVISEGNNAPSLNAGVSGVSIPVWTVSDQGYHNISAAVTTGSNTGVSKSLKAGVKNPPEFDSAKNLIVMVCEGLTPDLIESARTQYGELIIDSLPVSGTTKSVFSEDNKLLLDYLMNDIHKLMTGIVVYGDNSCNSMRQITSSLDNSASAHDVYMAQVERDNPLKVVMGKGDYSEYTSPSHETYLNFMGKAGGKEVHTLADAISLYKNNNVVFDSEHTGSVQKLYATFDNSTLPSFRQETAFSLSWMQEKNHRRGFCLLMSYSPSSALDANGVQDFDEAVAVAAKYVLENPDTALLICGCPADGSDANVCFYGIGKGVSVKDTFYKCVSSL